MLTRCRADVYGLLFRAGTAQEWRADGRAGSDDASAAAPSARLSRAAGRGDESGRLPPGRRAGHERLRDARGPGCAFVVRADAPTQAVGAIIELVREVISEFGVYVCGKRLVVNAWTLDNVSGDDDHALACCLDGTLRMNPERLLTVPHAVPGGSRRSEIVAALEAGRTKLRAAFSVREQDDGVWIELHGRRLRINRASWYDRAEQLALEEGLEVAAIRQGLLDRGLSDLATAMCVVDW